MSRRTCHDCGEKSEAVKKCAVLGCNLCPTCELVWGDRLSCDPANEAVHWTDMKFGGGDGVARPWKGGGS